MIERSQHIKTATIRTFICSVCGEETIASKTGPLGKTCTNCKNQKKICECKKCGLETKPGRRFINGHNTYNRTDEEKSLNALKIWESRRKSGKINHSDETKRKLSEMYLKRISEQGVPMQGKHHSPETKEKMSLAKLGKTTWNKDVPMSEETKEKLRQINLGKKASLETKEKISKGVKRAWTVYGPTVMSPTLSYSKQEVKVTTQMEKLGYKATWNNPFFIVGKDKTRVPDFVNVQDKKVIEIFGTYWHRDRVLPKGQRHLAPEEYIQWYKEAGYTCIVLWENEVDNYLLGNIEMESV